MTGVLLVLGVYLSIRGICKALSPKCVPYQPVARSNMRLVRKPFDWANDPEVAS